MIVVCLGNVLLPSELRWEAPTAPSLLAVSRVNFQARDTSKAHGINGYGTTRIKCVIKTVAFHTRADARCLSLTHETLKLTENRISFTDRDYNGLRALIGAIRTHAMAKNRISVPGLNCLCPGDVRCP